jgi:hypothetical protein
MTPTSRRCSRFLDRAWGITEAPRLRETGVGVVAKMPVTDWAPLLGLIAVDTAHASTVDLTQAVIVVQMPDSSSPLVSPMVIDGWRRIYRASQTGRTHVPDMVLDSEVETHIRLEPSVRVVHTGLARQEPSP